MKTENIKWHFKKKNSMRSIFSPLGQVFQECCTENMCGFYVMAGSVSCSLSINETIKWFHFFSIHIPLQQNSSYFLICSLLFFKQVLDALGSSSEVWWLISVVFYKILFRVNFLLEKSNEKSKKINGLCLRQRILLLFCLIELMNTLFASHYSQ